MSGTYAYQGAQDPGTTTTDYNSTVFVIQRELAKVNVGEPVKVVAAPYTVDGNGNRTAITPGAAGPIGFIDVQPLVNQVDGNGTPTEHGTVYQLTYLRYQGGNGAFISDPVVGDIGHMSVADRDTSVVLATSAVGNPGSGRRNDRSDGVYLPAIRSGSPGQWFAWTTTGFNLRDKNGNTIVGDATGITINGVKFPLSSPDVALPDGVTLNTHRHTEVTLGTDETGPPTAG